MQKTIILLSLISYVIGHGYMTFPIARQYRCLLANDFWWPEDGSGIQDPMCRAAYQYVFNKVYNEFGDRSNAASAAQYMLQQANEYAALAGPNYSDKCHIKQNVVPSYLCAAGAHDWNIIPFGDKSGMDVSGSWTPTVLPLPDNNQNVVPLELEFCPTAIHEPSYYELYITKPGFNVYIDKVVWDNLDLIFNNTVPLRERLPNSICTASSQVYRFTVPIPVRQTQFVLYVRWQRIDPVGEGFYNCIDAVFEYNEGPDEEDIIPGPNGNGEGGYEDCPAGFGAGCNHINNFDYSKYNKYVNTAIRQYEPHSCHHNHHYEHGHGKNKYKKNYKHKYGHHNNDHGHRHDYGCGK
jgi:predicted carbohydrate-binding protein with CBM5 and CBM33 domain